MAAQPANVLITGANRGLGLEMVKQMMEDPRPVRKMFACCRDPDGPRAQALRTLAKKHPNISIIRLDVSDLCSIKQGVQQVRSLVGTEGLNLLINNAAIVVDIGNLLETSPESMQNVFNTNVLGPMNMIKEFLPDLRAAVKASGVSGMSCSKAAVVNMSSVMGSMEFVKESYALFPKSVMSYRVSKAGLNMLTLCAAEDLKKDEILFSILHPGWVRTDMGGPEGQMDAPESVQGMLSVMASLTEKQNAAFLDHKGETLPW